MTREELFQWVKQEYGTEAEYPWKDSNAVLRRADNNKWYGVILSVAGSKLGLEDDNIIDVINLKSDPMLIGSLRGQKGYFPAYHMNKEKWISVLLGDAAPGMPPSDRYNHPYSIPDIPRDWTAPPSPPDSTVP